MSRLLLDTSIFIANEQQRPLGDLPAEFDQVSVSVVTLAELELGVLVAADTQSRVKRLATLTAAREIGAVLTVDERIGSAFAALIAELRQEKRSLRAQDAWIAATAIAHKATLCTQDNDFKKVPELPLLLM